MSENNKNFGPSSATDADYVNIKQKRKEINMRSRQQTPLDRYRARGEISDRHWNAGDRLRLLHCQAETMMRSNIRFTVNSGRTGGCWTGGNGLMPTERAAAANKALRAAFSALGPALRPIVSAVIIHDQPASDWARAQSRPVGHGLPTLICGLEALAWHFAIP